MTTKTRYQIAFFGFILSVVVFAAFTLVPALKATGKAGFWQGLAGGIAFGTLLGIMHYGRELRRERRAV